MADKPANEEPEEVLEEDEQVIPVEESEAPVDSEEPDENQDEETETEEETEEEPEPEKKVSRRKELRIQALVNKLSGKTAKDSPKPDVPGALDYKTALDADDETITKLEEDRRSYSEAFYQKGLDQAKAMQFHTRLEIDAPRIAAKFPLFDPESDQFDSTTADAINQWYLAQVGYDSKTDTVRNSDVRYGDFVEGIMELADELATRKVATTRKNVVKQAAKTGLRPDGSSPKRLNLNQSPDRMTDEELDAIIGSAIPSKK